MKIVIIVVVLLGALLFVGDRVLLSQHHGISNTSSTSKQNATTKVATTQQSNNPLSLYPKTSINCNTNASWVESTVDYIVIGMHCMAPSVTTSRFLSCNGTIFQHATNVDFDCYRSYHLTSSDQLQCNGTANGDADPTNLSLSYSCVLPSNMPGESNTTLYSCNGDMSDYSSFAVSLPMSVNCSGA